MKTLLLLLSACVSLAGSQTTIRGTIHDEEGKPVPYANVFLAGTTDGGMSDEQGSFSFVTKRSGTFELTASSVGFQRFRRSIVIRDGRSVQTFSVVMLPAVIAAQEVVVTASSYSSEKGKGVVLSSMDVLTTPGGAADIYQSLKTLPGLTQVSESAQLYVRGGDPTETVTIIDQAPMYNPYSLESAYGGLFSNLSTSAVKAMYFSSGGFSAKYGNVLSGVLDIETKDEPSLTRVSLLAGLHGAGLNAEVPISGERLGMRIDARQSYTRPIFLVNGGLDRFAATPKGHDLGGNIVFRYSQTGRLKLTGLYAGDGQSVNVERAEYRGVFDGSSTNRFLNLQHRDILFSDLLLRTSASLSRYRSTWELGILDLTRTDEVRKLRIDAEQWVSPRVKLSFGGEAERRKSVFAGVIPQHIYDVRPDAAHTAIENRVEGTRYGAYVELELQKLVGVENLVGIVGVRGDQIRPLGLTWFDPRAGVAYKIGSRSAVKFGWGIFHQLPDVRLFSSARGNPGLGSMRAAHYVLGYDLKLDELNDLRVEVYEKEYRGLPLEHPARNYDNSGTGYARGLDILAKGMLGPVSGWISYGFIDTKRMWMDFRESAPSSYDITHNLALVARYNITASLQIGVNFKHATGRPYSPIAGVRYDSTWHVYEPLYGARNSARYPDYRRMDVRLTYLTQLLGRHFTVAFVETLNVLNVNNIFGYTYTSDYSERREVQSYFGRRTLVFGVQVTM